MILINELELVFPNEKYKEQIFEYIEEHYKNNEYEIPGYKDLVDNESFDIWLSRVKQYTIIRKDAKIPESMYLVVRKSDDRIIGNVKIRSKLNDELRIRGGHVGYGVRPSERQKGYAKQILKLSLNLCKDMGLNKVLVTCDKNNIASVKTILSNGGVLEDEVVLNNDINKEKVIQRYWIQIK